MYVNIYVQALAASWEKSCMNHKGAMPSSALLTQLHHPLNFRTQ